MKNVLKGAVVAGALTLSVTAFANEADAAPATASWYGPGFGGNLTASGEVFDPYGYTAAHKTLPLGTELQVTYQGQTVDVVVNDRGPYANGADLDLSQGAAEAIGLTAAGVDTVDVQPAGAEAAPASGQAQVQPASTNGASYGGEGYTVQSGDTLSSIASRQGVSVDELAAANDISNVSLIFPGQEFSIPGGVSA